MITTMAMTANTRSATKRVTLLVMELKSGAGLPQTVHRRRFVWSSRRKPEHSLFQQGTSRWPSP